VACPSLPCRLLPRLGWRRHTDKLLVSEPLANDSPGGPQKARSVITRSVVEPERLFVNVAEQVERLDADIGAVDAPLEETPKILQAVRMDGTVHVGLGVVNSLVEIIAVQPFIRLESVGVDGRTKFYILADMGLQAALLAVCDDAGLDHAMPWAAVPFEDADDDSLARAASALDNFVPTVLVHEAGLAADEGFVHFDLTIGLLETAGLHGEPDTMEHEPGGLLCDAERSAQFVGADTILVVDDHPHGGQPLVQPDRAVLEDGAVFDRELPLGVFCLTLPAALIGKEGSFCAATSRAGEAVGPADAHHEVKAGIGVGEVLDGFEESLRSVHVMLPSVHIGSLTCQG